ASRRGDVLDRRRAGLHEPRLFNGLGKVGTDFYRGSAQLVRGGYRLESGAGRARPAEHWALSLWRSGDDSLPDSGNHTKRTILGVRAFFPRHSPGRAPFRFREHADGDQPCGLCKSGWNTGVGGVQPRTRADGNSANGSEEGGHCSGQGFRDHMGVVERAVSLVNSMSSVQSRPLVGGTPLVCLLAFSLAACGGGNQRALFTPTGPNAQVVLTTGDQAMLLQPGPTVAFGAGGSQSSPVITVNEATQYQMMDGFGASLTDSSAWVIWNDLDSSQQAALMQQLFSPTAGIGLNFLRQPMGATDFAVNGNYSYDDVPAGQTDPQLVDFSIAHDTTYIIPLLQRALAINPAAKVVALPWSPPAWMKVSGTMNGGNVNTVYFPSLLQYSVLYLQAYQQAGVPIYAISAQNRPLNSTSSYPSEYLAASDESDFIANYLGPALNNAGLGAVKILAYEHNWDNTDYPESVLASSASPYVAGSSFHCYNGDVSAQSGVKTAYPGKDIWFTECSDT